MHARYLNDTLKPWLVQFLIWPIWRMWYPDLYFVNSKAAVLQAVTTPNFMVMIYSDGLVFKSLRYFYCIFENAANWAAFQLIPFVTY